MIQTVAFTGARVITPAGAERVRAVVEALPRATRVLTGGCVGVDALVAWAAYHVDLSVHTVLPALDRYTDSEWARWCVSHEQLPPSPDPYRARNARLIFLADRLIAFPAWPEGDGRSRRSGTWMTVRLAYRAQKPVELYVLNGDA
jgi:predicted Rossmann-fold nucleotide-binding protein